MLLSRLDLANPDIASAPALYTYNGEILTYRNLYNSATNAKSYLDMNGINPISRVATIIPNGTLNSILVLSVIDVSICCPLSPSLNSQEYIPQLQALDADVVICTVELTSKLSPTCQALNINLFTVRLEANTSKLIFTAIYRRQENTRPARQSTNDYSLILLTSGSTGYPKRVGLSTDNILHSALEVASTLNLSPIDVCLSMWEQYHIGGIVDVLLAPLISRGAIRMTPGYSARVFQAISTSQSFSWLQCVPTTLMDMMNIIRSNKIHLSSELRLIRSVASQLSPQLHEEAEELFGVPILQTYGMTEASPLITSNLLASNSRRRGSVGLRLSTEVKILGLNDVALSAEMTGEICIRGKNVIASYDDPSAETSACFIEGWFRTGDLGYFDRDGFLWLVGRKKQQVNRGGEKISLREIENCALELAGILDAHAISMPHPTLGQVPGLLVSTVSPQDQSFKAVLDGHIRSRLSAYKYPARILILDSIPRTTTGKILHQHLRQLTEMLAKPSPAQCDASQASSFSYLETKLASIWSEELGINQFSLDDDFVALGGDSLSAVRVIVRAEEEFFVHYPESCWTSINTISRMAEVTNKLIRRSLTVSNRHYDSDLSTAVLDETTGQTFDSKSDLELAISTGVLGDVLIDELTSNELIRYILDAGRSRATVQAAVERKRNLWTPDELQQFYISYCSIANQLPLLHVNPYISAIGGSYKDDHVSLAWKSVPVESGVQLYYREGAPKKSLIVGFGGFFGRMMMPMDTWLKALGSLEHDFLFVWDKTRRFYNKGILGYANDPYVLALRLQETIDSLGYKSTVGIGVSMGGYPCAAIASSQAWERAIIVSPDRKSKHLPYQDLFCYEHRVPMIVTAGALHSYDVDSSVELANDSGATLSLIPDCSNHNALWHLYRRGLLTPALSKMINSITI